MKEYFLKFWGRDSLKALKELKLKGYNLWFNSKEDMENVENQLKNYRVKTTTKEGRMLTHVRTILNIDLEYNDKIYPIVHDFGYEYNAEEAKNLYAYGCYSDNNIKSTFIQQQIDTAFAEIYKGGDIKVKDISIRFAY